MMAAFHRKLREGAIRPAAYAALMGQVLAHIEAGAFQWLAQHSEIFLRIRHVYQKLPAVVFLRAADAIHLATAAESGFRIVYSNDAHLLGAAKYFGIEGRDVIGKAICPGTTSFQDRNPASVVRHECAALPRSDSRQPYGRSGREPLC